MMKSSEIRQALRVKGVPLWRLAKAIGVCEMTLMRWLRDEELPPERAERVAQAMEVLLNG